MHQVNRFLLPISLLLVSLNSFATLASSGNPKAEVKQTSHQAGQVSTVSLDKLSVERYQHLKQNQQQSLATQFGLSKVEFAKYLQIRSTTSMGYRYQGKHLDPNYLLADYYLAKGQNAKADRYIKNFARNEHQAVARELTIQKRFQYFVHQLYPTELPVPLKGPIPKDYTSFGFHPENTVAQMAQWQNNISGISGNRKYVLVVDMANDHVLPKLAQLRNKLEQLQNVRLDIYDAGDATNQQIVAWAKANGITPAMLQQHLVTLNHGGHFLPLLAKQLGQNIQPGTLLKNDDGNYLQLSWSEVS